MQAAPRDYSIEEIVKAVLEGLRKESKEETKTITMVDGVEECHEEDGITRFIDELEGIIVDLEQVDSLFGCMKRSYFSKIPKLEDEEERKAIEYDIIENFDNYTDMMDLMQDIIRNKEQDLRKLTYSLHDEIKEIVLIAERNLSLLR